ncbi:MAG: class B sortase [Lachnospiraceae bacterium]|nr:class B sortase [Lachnospiraceae bacterium]
MLLFFCAFIISLAAAIFFYKQDKKQEEQFEELARLEDQDRDNITFDGEGSADSPLPLIDNSDCIGWLKIEDTTISYPIMQRIGDGEYYLHRDYKGGYSFYGTPFLDIRCTPESDNCILYGHNINGRRMFGALHAYADQSYYREHTEIQIRFGEETNTYQIVAVIPTSISDKIYDFTDVGNWEEYREYVGEILDRASYQTDMGEEIRSEFIKDSPEQFFRRYEFVTLSTCRSWVGRDARLLVIAGRKRQK